ncbi:phosphoglucomutase [Weissella oryzae SG25]|uniref:Phosphoglucomutase n=1 Tax=Weissella oryzae (strain DSM 25784 / JCM 18191 / LMG 30913 / SG25) TaxID=1329250 RepID=A0A069CT37_WEIOS|nr:phospho-sugar mutase [Weissella oryzae]GAK30567.1 phosphoglucomutase [Weissella oryzae SG25]
MPWKDVYQAWLDEPKMPSALAAELRSMDAATQEDAFYQPLSFGTAGMRGLLGAGINRMNIFTVRQATEGLARLMDLQAADVKTRGVVISYDSRHFSQDFAYEAAGVLAAHGIKAYVFESLRPTPELSFAVRYLHTYAGIMITASHNPKEYNGYKIYGEDGGQMPPKESDIVTASIREADMFNVKAESIEAMKAANLLEVIGDAVDQAYLAEIKTVTINQALIDTVGKDMKLVYSPLHGTGAKIAGAALHNAGFEQVTIVPEQAEPDGDFPTVKLPNPEDHAALAMGIDLAKREGADVVIAVDPDADRMGTAVRMPTGDYQLLTGNQIGAILLNYILTAKQADHTLPTNGALVKSIVSSEFATAIAANLGVTTVNVLTGFKYIAEQIQHYEDTNEHTFLFGFEESYGYLVKGFVRDKDSVQVTVLLAEVAAYYKSLGMTLYDGLQELFEKYGYYVEKTNSLTFAGIDGADKIAELMAKFRTNMPTEFGGVAVVKLEDFASQLEIDLTNQAEQPLILPKANVLKYWLSDGSWVAVRPSGTEPKIKFYIGTKGESALAADEELAAIEASINAYL